MANSLSREAHPAIISGSSGGHELSEARLEEVASRLVADALSRAVHKCYAERMGGNTGRQVHAYLVWFFIISYTDQGARSLSYLKPSVGWYSNICNH